ncbi:MAG TPA: hypothetical protein VF695_08695 [Sphingomonas sp.]
MNDQDEVPQGPEGWMMLYDSFKHVTSLCLFTLAGGVALADKVQGRWAVMLVLALVMVGAAAVIALSATGQIVDARLAGRTSIPNLRLSRLAPGMLLSTGVGILLYVFTRSLKF